MSPKNCCKLHACLLRLKKWAFLCTLLFIIPPATPPMTNSWISASYLALHVVELCSYLYIEDGTVTKKPSAVANNPTSIKIRGN